MDRVNNQCQLVSKRPDLNQCKGNSKDNCRKQKSGCKIEFTFVFCSHKVPPYVLTFIFLNLNMLDSYGVSIDSSPMAFYALISGIQKVDQLLNNPVLLLCA